MNRKEGLPMRATEKTGKMEPGGKPGGKRGEAIAVIGAGAWGTTLACLQSSNFHRVNLYMRDPGKCEEIVRFRRNHAYSGDKALPHNILPTTSIRRAVEDSSLVVVAVPSRALRETVSAICRARRSDVPLVLATKGMEAGTGLLGLEIFREVAARPGRRSGRDPLVLGGPNLAREIQAGLPAVSVLAGSNDRELSRVMGSLSHTLLSLVAYGDPLAVQISGALKNVYAVGCGIASGMGWGENVVSALIWRGLSETALFARALGSDPGVVDTPAGVADFLATCQSTLSRNRGLGLILAGASPKNVVGVREGAGTAQEAVRRSRSLGLRLPTLEAVGSVMAGSAGPGSVLDAVFAGAEHGSGVERLPGRTGSAFLSMELQP